MAQFQPDQNLHQNLESLVSRKLAAASKKGADILRERLSRGYEERTGKTFYSKQNVYSSTSDQYPQEVTGQLMRSVGSRQNAPLSYLSGVGLADSSGMPQSALLRLNNGSSDGSMGGRYFMERTYFDADVQGQMMQATREV